MIRTTVFILGLLSLSTYAKDPAQRNMGLKLNALPFLAGVIDAQYDYKLTNKVAFSAALDVGNIWLISGHANNASSGAVYAFGLGAHLNSNSVLHSGWYLNPMLRFGHHKSYSTATNLWFVPSIGAGYEWLWASGFWLSAGLDLYSPVSLSPTSEGRFLLFSFPAPLLAIGVGYAW